MFLFSSSRGRRSSLSSRGRRPWRSSFSFILLTLSFGVSLGTSFEVRGAYSQSRSETPYALLALVLAVPLQQAARIAARPVAPTHNSTTSLNKSRTGRRSKVGFVSCLKSSKRIDVTRGSRRAERFKPGREFVQEEGHWFLDWFR